MWLGPHCIVELQLQSSVEISFCDVHQRLRRVHRSSQDQGLSHHITTTVVVVVTAHQYRLVSCCQSWCCCWSR